MGISARTSRSWYRIKSVSGLYQIPSDASCSSPELDGVLGDADRVGCAAARSLWICFSFLSNSLRCASMTRCASVNAACVLASSCSKSSYAALSACDSTSRLEASRLEKSNRVGASVQRTRLL